MKKRNSVFEILRIVAILMVILSHYSAYGGVDVPSLSFGLNSIVLNQARLGDTGVVIFFMISGFFMVYSTKVSISKIVRLALTALFFMITFYFISISVGTIEFSWKGLYLSVMFIFFGEYWFVVTYLLIYIFHPIINKVGISILPKFQNDHKSLRKYFSKIISVKGVINAFTYGLIAILATYAVQLLYGNDYLSIVPYVQLFAALIYLRSMGSLVGILVITTGRTDYEFYWNILITLFTPIAVFIGAQYSILMVIILMVFVQLSLLFPGWYIFYKRLINLDFLPYIKSNIVPALISLIIVIFNLLFTESNLIIEISMSLLLTSSLLLYSYISFEEVKKISKKIMKIC